MKKLRLSLAALALIVTIAGTATANAKTAEADPCYKVDPKGTECLNQNDIPCCEDDLGNTIYQKNPL